VTRPAIVAAYLVATAAVLAAAGLQTSGAVVRAGGVQVSGPAPHWTASIADIRRIAALIPGRRPLRLNVQKFAESRRAKNFSVKGAPAEPSVQARTVFQVKYDDGTVMVDAGMDRQVHAFFGRGVDEPYDADAATHVQRAVAESRLIVVTHEHGDHVAGVIGAANAAQLAAKTILTRTQLQVLTTMPQMPEIRLPPELAARFIAIDYDRYYPLAPGMVLIKAAGHTPGSQMVYVALDSGREYVLVGDATWHMDGVRQVQGKDAPWITEDVPAVLDQLRWLNQLSMSEPNVAIVPSHDEEQRRALISNGALHDGLE
jgi:glyoxylase-like metal-dependent hydrolase (beta-lactamase superfamily II)